MTSCLLVSPSSLSSTIVVAVGVFTVGLPRDASGRRLF